MKYNIKILYVEDEVDIRNNTSRPLKYLCDELIVGVDGEDGLELFKKHKPDIVISDIKMPKMDGIQMSKAIKEISKNAHIVFTTAHSDSSFFMEAIELQVDGFVLKPIDYKLLKKKINTITEQVRLKKRFQEQQIIIDEITRLQDNLLIVLDENQFIIFSNNKFLEFFKISDLDNFAKKHQKLGGLLLENDDIFSDTKSDSDWIQQIKSLADDKKVISMSDSEVESKSFVLSLKHIKETSHIIVIFTEITTLENERKKLVAKAYTDELTQIYNRAYFEDQFEKDVFLFRQQAIPLSFIILDIDKFKNFNDTYGHQMGDKILKDLALIVNKHTRHTDTFARWGGEEFVEILSGTSLAGAIKVAENLRKIIDNHIFKDGLKVTCSFGVSEFKVFDNKDSLMKRADDALYRAKENGRNRVEQENCKL